MTDWSTWVTGDRDAVVLHLDGTEYLLDAEDAAAIGRSLEARSEEVDR